MGRNGRTDLPRGSTKRSLPLSWTVFFTGLLVDWLQLGGSSSNWPDSPSKSPNPALLLISGNVHPHPGPIRNNSRPRYPCSICHFNVGRDSLQCSTCLRWVHFHCSSLTCADFRTICATGSAVGWRCPACCPQIKLAPLLRPITPLWSLRPLQPLPQGSPH